MPDNSLSANLTACAACTSRPAADPSQGAASRNPDEGEGSFAGVLAARSAATPEQRAAPPASGEDSAKDAAQESAAPPTEGTSEAAVLLLSLGIATGVPLSSIAISLKAAGAAFRTTTAADASASAQANPLAAAAQAMTADLAAPAQRLARLRAEDTKGAGEAGAASMLQHRAGQTGWFLSAPAAGNDSPGRPIVDLAGATLKAAPELPSFAHTGGARPEAPPPAMPPLFAASAPAAPPAGGAAAAPAPVIAAPLHAAQWPAQFGAGVLWTIGTGEQSATLQITPPELGPIHIELHVQEGRAEAVFSAAQADVRQAIESALPQLREMLAGSGVTLGEVSIGAGSSGQPDGEAPHRQAGASSSQPGDEPAATALRVHSRGLLDVFA